MLIASIATKFFGQGAAGNLTRAHEMWAAPPPAGVNWKRRRVSA